MKAFKNLEIGDTIYIFWIKIKASIGDKLSIYISEVKTAKVTYVEEYHSTIRLSYHTSTYGRTVLVPLDNCISEGLGEEFIASGPEALLSLTNLNNAKYPIGIYTKFRHRFFNCSIPQQIYIDNRHSIDYDKRKMILAYMEYLYDEGIPFTSSDDCISYLIDNEYSITFKAVSTNEFVIKGFCLSDTYTDLDKAQSIVDKCNTKYPYFHYELIKDLNRIVISYRCPVSDFPKRSFYHTIDDVFTQVRDLYYKHRNGRI